MFDSKNFHCLELSKKINIILFGQLLIIRLLEGEGVTNSLNVFENRKGFYAEQNTDSLPLDNTN